MKRFIATAKLAAVVLLAAASAAEAKRLPWCGIYMNSYFGMSKRSLWVARNWAREGVAASGPTVGAVVVWRHHVGVIAGPPDARGRWLVHSGNDGNAVRTRYRSLRGAIAFRHVGSSSRLASNNLNIEIQQHAAAGSNQNLVSLRDSSRPVKPLRQARALAVAAARVSTVLVGGGALAHSTDFADVMRPQYVEPVGKRSRVVRNRLAVADASGHAVYAMASVGETKLFSHRHAPRTARAPAAVHPSSPAWQQSALNMPRATASPGSVERALYVGGAVGWHEFRSPAAQRGYRPRYRP